MITRTSRLLRWLLLIPAALGAGFVVGGLIALVPNGGQGTANGLTYATAFLSGLAYVWAALHVAHAIAPSHKKIVVVVLGLLILGDLSFVHLVMSRSEDNGLRVLLQILRADDYVEVPAAGFVKIAGVLSGCFIAWWKYVKREVAGRVETIG